MELTNGTIFTNNQVELRLTVSTEKTAAYTAVDTDDVILVDTSGGAVTITLPSALIAKPGYQVVVKDSGGAAGTNNVTVATEGAETVDGNATGTISTNGGTLRLVSNGTNLFSI